jgi:hypothetical protein
MDSIAQLDTILNKCLGDLAKDPHVRMWHAKENNWVSYFGGTCWDANWEVSRDPLNDPLVIIE